MHLVAFTCRTSEQSGNKSRVRKVTGNHEVVPISCGKPRKCTTDSVHCHHFRKQSQQSCILQSFQCADSFFIFNFRSLKFQPSLSPVLVQLEKITIKANYLLLVCLKKFLFTSKLLDNFLNAAFPLTCFM